MVHRPSQWSTVLCLHTLKADCPSSCLIPSTFLNLWVLVPLTAKQPIGWNIKAPPLFLWKQDDITSHKPSALSHPPHRVMVVFQSWIHQIPEEQNQWPLHCQPEFLLQMIRSQALTVCFHPALLKAISPKCILRGQWVSIHAQFHMKRFALFIARMAWIGQPVWKYFHSLACQMMALAWNLGRDCHRLTES